MSVYVDSLPPTCEVCVCNDDDWRCNLTGEELDGCEKKLPNCPLKELVRCGDCAYSEVTDNVRFCMCEDGLGRCVADNEFCSEGVKNDN